jgi:hypothetical protein
MSRGQIGLKGMREILQHPELLGRIPYLLETPKYLPRYRAIRRRNRTIQDLDDRLGRLERECLADLLAFSDDDWQDIEKRQDWWSKRQRMERDVKRKIGRLIRVSRKLRDGDAWKERIRSRQIGKRGKVIIRIGSRRYSRRQLHSKE